MDQAGRISYMTDIQEILVERETEMKFNPSPNPYNPEDESYFDK